MNIINHTNQDNVLYKFKTFCHNEVNILSGSIALGFPLINGGAGLKQILDVQQLRAIITNKIGDEVFWDLGLPKGSAEFLIYGNAYATNLSRAISVSARVGDISKLLMIFGDRSWNELGMSEAALFQTMPIKYNLAYGGSNYPLNPLGKGHFGSDLSSALPNIELPDQLVMTKSDVPEIAGFEPYPFNWPQRDQYFVDYPEFNHETEFIFEKTIPEYFNTAPMDQRLKGFFSGNEEIEIKNMHPFIPVLKATLPKVKLRVFTLQKDINGKYIFGELPVAIETLSLLPEWERGILLYRISHPIQDLVASDIVYTYIALEELGQAQSVEYHYQNLMEQLPKPSGEEVIDNPVTSVATENLPDHENTQSQDERNNLSNTLDLKNQELIEIKGIETFFELCQDLVNGKTHNLDENSINIIKQVYELMNQMEISKSGVQEFIINRQKDGLPPLLSGDEILNHLKDVWEKNPVLHEKLKASLNILDKLKTNLYK